MEKLTGLVADLQRASIHDGPGLRTTVFLKGCQMDCAWCHNPETISFAPQELYYPDKCIGCGGCAEGCFAGARVLCGSPMTVNEVMAQVLEDTPYYGADGGLTVSGGEPLCQPDFTLALMQAAKSAGVHAALESNLCLPWDTARPVLQQVDLVMGDLKLWDEEAHRKWTGVSNTLVRQNFKNASEMGLPVILRTPVVPGVNDTDEEIGAIARYAAGLDTLLYYELLTYHPLGLGKAQALGIEGQRFEKPGKARMEALARLAKRAGVVVRVNNVPYV